jgi:hypothetical protein
VDKDKATKRDLIKYIKANEPSFADIDMSNYSVTQLIIIKVGVEVTIKKINKEKK